MPAELEMVLRLVLATLLGAVIGVEREHKGKAAGLRTHTLISLGAAVFTVTSIFAFGSDPARVAANIVTGIGFIGAGSILSNRQEGIVTGLTTAASMWITAAIGLAAGAGLYLFATVGTLLALAVLMLRSKWAR